MPWYAWAMVAVLALNLLVTISQIGKSRPPIAPETVMATLIVNGLMVWGIVALAH